MFVLSAAAPGLLWRLTVQSVLRFFEPLALHVKVVGVQRHLQ